MKKLVVLFAVFLMMFLAGCKETVEDTGDDLPPEPKVPSEESENPSNIVGQAYNYVEGYAPPVDVFNNNKEIFSLTSNLFNLDIETDTFDLGFKVSHEAALIYKKGYYYTKNGWQPFIFNEETYKGSNWIKGYASKSINLNVNDFVEGENYIIAYSCKKHEGKWKCGCRYKEGPCYMWMLQTFVIRRTDIPPEPRKPGEIITTNVYVYADNRIVRTNQEMNLYAYITSNQDLSREMPNARFVIVKPDNSIEKIAPSENFDMYCRSCTGTQCYYNYECSTNLNAKYIPTIEGNYSLNFSIEGIENLRVNSDRFYVNDRIFTENLIEQNIGVLNYTGSSGYLYEDGYLVQAYYGSRDYNVYGNVKVQIRNNILEIFKKQVRRSGYRLLNVSNNIIYYNKNQYETYDINGQIAYYTSISYIWMSNGKLISVSASGNENQFEDLMKAYLNKHKSDNVIVEEEHYPEILIESNIGDYYYVKSYSDYSTDFKYYMAEYDNQNDNNSYQAVVMLLKNENKIPYYFYHYPFNTTTLEGHKFYSYSTYYYNIAYWASGPRILTIKNNFERSVRDGNYLDPSLLPQKLILAYLERYLSDLNCQIKDILKDEEIKTYQISSVDYTVKPFDTSVITNTTMIKLNNEVSPLIKEGQSYQFTNVKVRVTDIFKDDNIGSSGSGGGGGGSVNTTSTQIIADNRYYVGICIN